MIKNWIRSIILDIVQEETIKPQFKELKKVQFKLNGKHDVYDILESQDIENVYLTIYYVDPSSHATQTYRLERGTIAEFKKALEVYTPHLDYFNGVHFGVYYNHAFGKQHSSDVIINTLDKKIYKTSELQNIFKPIIVWLNKRPELLL